MVQEGLRKRLILPGSQYPDMPLDCKMGFESRKHYSLGMIEQIVESVAITISRSASELLQSLAGITISHQSVISLKNYAGKKAKAYEKAFVEEKTDKKPVQPEIIAIEGGWNHPQEQEERRRLGGASPSGIRGSQEKWQQDRTGRTSLFCVHQQERTFCNGRRLPGSPALPLINSEEKCVTDFHVCCVFFYAKEMNHRFYSYRMKQQGRNWSSEEME